MKKLLPLILLAASMQCMAAEPPQKKSMQTIAGLYVDASESYEMLVNPAGRKVILVDVRDPVEIKFTGYTTMTAVHVPWKIIDAKVWDEKTESFGGHLNDHFAAAVVSRLDAIGAGKDSHLIFMCRSGSTRSAPAADALYQAGYKNAYSMVDGFEGSKAKNGRYMGARVVNGWKNSGLPWGWTLDKDVVYGGES